MYRDIFGINFLVYRDGVYIVLYDILYEYCFVLDWNVLMLLDE